MSILVFRVNDTCENESEVFENEDLFCRLIGFQKISVEFVNVPEICRKPNTYAVAMKNNFTKTQRDVIRARFHDQVFKARSDALSVVLLDE